MFEIENVFLHALPVAAVYSMVSLYIYLYIYIYIYIIYIYIYIYKCTSLTKHYIAYAGLPDDIEKIIE